MRTELQRETDQVDCDLCRLELRLAELADRMPVAGPKLFEASRVISTARSLVRRFMHEEDRAKTPY